MYVCRAIAGSGGRCGGAIGSYDIFRCVVTAVRGLLLLLFNRGSLWVAVGSVLDIGAEIECRLHIL